MANPFVADPIRVVVFDPMTGSTRRAFVFLGNVPKAVQNACHYYHTSSASARAGFDKILREHYGKDFASKLGLNVKDYERAWVPARPEITGGEDVNRTTFLRDYDPDCLDKYADAEVHLVPSAQLQRSARAVSAGPTRANSAICVKLDGIIHVLSGDDAIIAGAPAPVRFIDPKYLAACRTVGGGAEFDDSDIAKLLDEAPADGVVKSITSAASTGELKVDFSPGIEYVADVCLYPEDNFINLKEKVFISAGIPAYRQHIFYNGHGAMRTTYNIYAEGAYSAEIQDLATERDNVHGLPVDKLLYNLRDDIKVEALDTFFTLGSALDDGIIYVVDLAQFTRKIASQMSAILSDTYQFDILYYGLIIKYWPMLTRECFYDYVQNEGDLQHKYPELAKNRSRLVSMYKLERELIEYKYANVQKAMAYAAANTNSAITNITTVVQSIGVEINIRNLFDLMQVGPLMPEIRAYVAVDGKKLLLRKRYTGAIEEIRFPLQQSMRLGIVAAVIAGPHQLFLNIMPSGRCMVKTVWPEEDQMQFADVLAVVKKHIQPIFDTINAMGRYVFIAGFKLPDINKTTVSFQGMTISLFWKRVINQRSYKVVMEHLEDYIRSGIMGARMQQPGKYTFTFRKGIYQYDTSQISKIMTAATGATLSNQYAYLSSNAVLQKWLQHYDGRIVKLDHRTADLAFEVSDIRESEFPTFIEYISSLIYRAVHSAAFREAEQAQPDYTGTKRLRKLREQDPELYNLKKHGSDKVYSILCQNQRQPTIYTAEEVRRLSPKVAAKLIKYWNFTTQKPAMYGCSNPQYPHLSFITGQHPKGYCMPCCNKKPSKGDDNKRGRVNTECLANHVYNETETSEDISRHIMGYGKSIDTGRLSHLPQIILRDLLGGNSAEGPGFYTFGVPQHLPNISNVGLIFAIAEGLGVSIAQLAEKLAEKILSSPDTFPSLAEGSLGEYFADSADFAQALREIFAVGKIHLYNDFRFNEWPEAIAELVYTFLGVGVVVFDDPRADAGGVDLVVSNIVRYDLLTDATSEYIAVMKSGARYYPIFMISLADYYKNGTIATRRYSRDSVLVGAVISMLRYDNERGGAGVNEPITLELLREISAQIVGKRVNKHNLCYVVAVDSGRGVVDIPIAFSVNVPDGIHILPGPPAPASVDAVFDVISAINKHIRAKYAISEILSKYELIEPQYALTAGGQLFGIKIQRGVIYCNGKPPADLQVVEARYNYAAINELILQGAPPALDNRSKLLSGALYSNYNYQLFLLEFMNYVSHDRNKPMRSAITEIIEQTNIKAGLHTLRSKLKTLLSDYFTDYNTILDMIYQSQKTGMDKRSILAQFDESVYEFDRVLVNKLRQMQAADLEAELIKIGSSFAVYKEIDVVSFPNIYGPCASGKQPYCDGKKLIINQPIEQYAKILAADIHNELKSKYILNNIWADTALDYFSFIQRQNETITIYELSY